MQFAPKRCSLYSRDGLSTTAALQLASRRKDNRIHVAAHVALSRSVKVQLGRPLLALCSACLCSSRGVLSCPLSRFPVVLVSVVQVLRGDVVHERVFGVGVRQQTDYRQQHLADCQRGTPARRGNHNSRGHAVAHRQQKASSAQCAAWAALSKVYALRCSGWHVRGLVWRPVVFQYV